MKSQRTREDIIKGINNASNQSDAMYAALLEIGLDIRELLGVERITADSNGEVLGREIILDKEE